MSTVMPIESKCYVCGNVSKQWVLGSTSEFGASDLDTRPPMMARSTMDLWIAQCPHCGYVAGDLSDATSITKEWLQNEQYITCDNRNFASELAQNFYKCYLIAVENRQHRNAFYAAMHTAWVCDDVDDVENAIYSRNKALDELAKFVDDAVEKETLLLIRADLLRRTGQFDLLIKEYEGTIFSKQLLNKIVAFQIKIAKEQDTGCYTVRDVLCDEE